jgi:N-ethylmaleimide reductase
VTFVVTPAVMFEHHQTFRGAEMKLPSLFSPLKVGPYQLSHRVVMAPLTRMRAEKDSFAPRPLNAEYYGQRATEGGLIIAEASPVMAVGRGNPATPGIYTDAQTKGWRAVVDAVHAKGGLIFLQLWHVGRVSHSSFHGGALPVAPSAVSITGAGMMAMTADGKVAPYETPRALETSEIPGIVDAFRQGARNALAAGFDGVEIHGANGYLLEQFLQSRSNLRTDQYGGSIENRARLLMEITQAVIEVWGANRVGVRLTPYGIANGSGEADPMPLYSHVVKALDKLGLAYLHFIEPRSSGAGRAEVNHQNVPSAMVLFRPFWSGVLISAGGFTGETAEAAIAEGHADAIAFGRIFISNPDLPRRLRHGFPITPYNRATFYGGDVAGYTDYPAYDEMAPA